MPEITISEEQRDYLETLRSELARKFVGEYGYVRDRDVLQFLIDSREGATDGEGIGDGGDGAEAAEDEDPGSRLAAMMALLDRHEDKWDETDSDEGKYAVTLPDGSEEHVRTRDEVKGLLFKHYR